MKKKRKHTLIASTLSLFITGHVSAEELPEYCDTWQEMITAVEFYNANVNGCIYHVQRGHGDQEEDCIRTNAAFNRFDDLYTKLSAFDDLPQSLSDVSKSCDGNTSNDMYAINTFNQAKCKYTSALMIYKEVLEKQMNMMR